MPLGPDPQRRAQGVREGIRLILPLPWKQDIVRLVLVPLPAVDILADNVIIADDIDGTPPVGKELPDRADVARGFGPVGQLPLGRAVFRGDLGRALEGVASHFVRGGVLVVILTR